MFVHRNRMIDSMLFILGGSYQSFFLSLPNTSCETPEEAGLLRYPLAIRRIAILFNSKKYTHNKSKHLESDNA